MWSGSAQYTEQIVWTYTSRKSWLLVFWKFSNSIFLFCKNEYQYQDVHLSYKRALAPYIQIMGCHNFLVNYPLYSYLKLITLGIALFVSYIETFLAWDVA